MVCNRVPSTQAGVCRLAEPDGGAAGALCLLAGGKVAGAARWVKGWGDRDIFVDLQTLLMMNKKVVTQDGTIPFFTIWSKN